MEKRTTMQTLVVAAVLILMMAATRSSHFGSALSLPDASLAVFFIAGFYLLSKRWLLLFLAEAALVDYLSITYGGSGSSWCVTPAYAMLLPTYAVLWWSGRWYAQRHRFAWRTLMPLLLSMGIAVFVAFQLSSGSYYLFSGRFPEPSWAEYGGRIALYFPSYLYSAVLYVAVFAVAYGVGVWMKRAFADPAELHTTRSSK